ncbi:MAG TPA: hypothetical protein PKX55_23830, partial [Leptospiraceae bacterium]|nr:hypothetical protein [Leptospiraceae bacterium]
MNLSFLLRIIFFTVLLFTFPIFSDDWSDLDEGEKKEVYGSEKSKKYKMSNIFGEVESWDKHYAVRIIYLYDYTDYPKYNSTQFIPFYYRLNSKIDNREKLRFINYTTEIQKSKVDKSILPLFYWGHNNDLKLNYQLFLPVYYNSSTNNSNLTENKFIFIPIPFYYSFEDKNKKNSTSEKHYSILHGRVLQKKKNSNDTLESSFWFPGFPLMRYTKGQDFYYHYIIPFYGYSRTENLQREETTFLFSLFPFYYSASSYPIDGNNKHSELTHWTLFYYRSLEEDKGGFREYTHKTVWGFPVLPVLYYSSFRQGEGYYKRILTFFHWEKDEKEELNSLSFLPFFFYKKNDYFRIPILFINKDLSSPSASYGKTFVPLLLYYNRWDLSSQTTVLGPWIYTENKLKNESFKTLFPIYWKSESEKKDITLIFPIYANYNDKENDYHFNPIWFSRANLGTLNPSLSLGKKEGIWYLDTDFTFFYYLASLSFRQTIEKPKFLRDVLNRNKSYEELEKENKEEKVRIKKESKDSSDPKITKRKTITREDSLSFSGYSLLFGLLSYEAADSKRHFRLLPLSWFSWDKESDDKVYVAPLFLWYQSDLLEYLVLFPFYGKQKDESSEKKAFLLNVYISEFYKDKNWVEKSILWPLANQYTSED